MIKTRNYGETYKYIPKQAPNKDACRFRAVAFKNNSQKYPVRLQLELETVIITGKIKTESRSSTVESGRAGVIYQRKEQLVVSPE